MVLVSSDQADTEFDLSSYALVYGTTYYWRIDSKNEHGTALGDVWSFTALVFSAPNDVVVVNRLVAAANNTIFYEDE